ncbi:MAG TPA: nucleotidyltransferase family protein [Acidimicrobiales bacterium]|jgi:molybdenum cofactor cytidylyltransferase|nr:nucleotidyltransferase family protein [Acidimicrobiales bacterium]
MTAAVLLCAGGSSRFGEQPKLLAPFRGRPLVTWALDHALGAGLDETFVVVGPVDLSALLPGAVVVDNPAWASGQASSLLAGIAAAEQRGHGVVVVGLGDQPRVPSEAWSAVAETDSPIAVASFNGTRTPPTRLARSVWGLLPQHGDTGARALMQARPDLVVEVPCAGEALDIDTTEDLLS